MMVCIVNAYTTDNQYLWHFALWRIQSLFEAVIVHQLLDNKSTILFGLKSKIEALEKSGFTISSSEKEELLLWANLRNSFSHAPPEQYRPTGLNEPDLSRVMNVHPQFFDN